MTLTHFDSDGRPQMVDVSAKTETSRMARAEVGVKMQRQTLDLVLNKAAAKGDVIATAELAGIMGAKRAADLIPLCHPLPISKVRLVITPEPDLPGLHIEAEVRCTGRTGVEMEALTAASVAALTVYDMLKAAEKGMEITGLRLLHKEGGKSGVYQAE